MPRPAEQQIIEWVNDAFAVVSRGRPGDVPAEANLRRGLEAIVRHLSDYAPPLTDGSPNPIGHHVEITQHELELVLQTLDACLGLFARYDRQLNTAQRRILILVRACRRNADEAVRGPGTLRAAPLQVLRR